jgi:hypothetical protein
MPNRARETHGDIAITTSIPTAVIEANFD